MTFFHLFLIHHACSSGFTSIPITAQASLLSCRPRAKEQSQSFTIWSVFFLLFLSYSCSCLALAFVFERNKHREFLPAPLLPPFPFPSHTHHGCGHPTILRSATTTPPSATCIPLLHLNLHHFHHYLHLPYSNHCTHPFLPPSLPPPLGSLPTRLRLALPPNSSTILTPQTITTTNINCQPSFCSIALNDHLANLSFA